MSKRKLINVDATCIDDEGNFIVFMYYKDKMEIEFMNEPKGQFLKTSFTYAI